MAISVAVTLCSLVLFNAIFYLWWVDRGMRSVPAEAAKLARKRWTDEDFRNAYKKVRENPTDVRPFIFPKRDRRYIVSGGSGLVGGWIVQHLLLRGQDPAAIRILDIQPPTRPEVAENNVQWMETDVSSPSSVEAGFQEPWDPKVAKLPLTVFHTVAYINAGDRAPDFWDPFEKVNVKGTENVLASAQAAGASCFVSTSSISIGVKLIKFFFPPWKSTAKNFLQITENSDPVPNGQLKDFTGCYAYSKYLAERKVLAADKPGFRTGALRPGNSIYGSGIQYRSSFVYETLSRGGFPTWLSTSVTNFVSAQNVSVAHLAFENTLLNDPSSPKGGHAFQCTDPGPPIVYRDLYRLLETLAHPSRPVKCPTIPFVPVLLVCYLSEAYQLLQHRYLRFLPRATGDLALLQPCMLRMASGHIIFDQTKTYREIGYRPPIDTLEGLADQVLYFNNLVEADLNEKAANPRALQKSKTMP